MQSQTTPPVRDLVLVGGGHAHIQVLRRFGMQPAPGIRLSLISPQVDTPYSGMLPGCVAGTYTAEDIHINLVRLCQFAGARYLHATVNGLDLENRRVSMVGRPDLRFDLLSINCGATPAVAEQASAVKPISTFLPRWQSACERLQGGGHLVLIGAGAGGVELALAARSALPETVRITLVGPDILPGRGAGARKVVERTFARRAIEWVCDRVVKQAADEVHLASGQTLAADEVFWVTGVAAPEWIQQSGLQTDDAGFMSVNPHLQSVSHPEVFGAGDAVDLAGQSRPKSGVFAVREGPVLAANLRSALENEPLKRYRAQRKHLALLGLGDGRALAVRGSWAAQGRVWWQLKQWIDLRFMQKFNSLPQMSETRPSLPGNMATDLPKDLMRCGGCGAKIAAVPLRRVLARLPRQDHPKVRLGIGDDAAEIVSSGSQLLSVDGFRAMIDDPYLLGRIVTHHSLNDIFAMGATPTGALAMVTVPLMAERMMEEDLFQLLNGVCDVLGEHQAALVGGHSAEGAELSIALTVTGDPGDQVLTKAGAEVGDTLILTKPLGTGTVLAAMMQGTADASTAQEVLKGMDQSNAQAVQVFRSHRVSALTDITGFGLAGHLGEMLRASDLGAVLDLATVPVYGQALQMLAANPSSLQEANEHALADFELSGKWLPADPRVRMLADPQTSGGLLAAIPESLSESCLAGLHQAGVAAVAIGSVHETRWVLD